MSRAAACVVIVAVASLSALQWLCEGACADRTDPTPTCHARPGADASKLRAASHDCADHRLASAMSPSASRFEIFLTAVTGESTPPAIQLFALAPAPGARDESPPVVSRRGPLRI